MPILRRAWKDTEKAASHVGWEWFMVIASTISAFVLGVSNADIVAGFKAGALTALLVSLAVFLINLVSAPGLLISENAAKIAKLKEKARDPGGPRPAFPPPDKKLVADRGLYQAIRDRFPSSLAFGLIECDYREIFDAAPLAAVAEVAKSARYPEEQFFDAELLALQGGLADACDVFIETVPKFCSYSDSDESARIVEDPTGFYEEDEANDRLRELATTIQERHRALFEAARRKLEV